MLAWQLAALLAAAVMASCNVLDSYMISKRIGRVRPYMLLITLPVFIVCIFLFIFNFPHGVSAEYMWAAIGSGVLRSTALLIMYFVMKSEAVSKIIPITYTYPVFVAIMAMVFLGDSIATLQWLAIVLVVAGAVLISVKGKSKDSISKSANWKTVALLLFSAVILAATDVLSNYAMREMSTIATFCILHFVMFIMFWAVAARPANLKTALEVIKKPSNVLLLFLGQVGIIGGRFLTYYSLGQGEVAVASALLGIRPFFVLVISTIVALLFKDSLKEGRTSGQVMVRRLIAITMIVLGVAILYLAPES